MKSHISLIVAVANNGVIGREGAMAWNLPSELANFKKITMGHPMIMGRKTYESIGRPLPGRTNIVVTHDTDYEAEGCVVVNSLEDAIGEAEKVPGGQEEIFVIGGQAIFELAMPLASRLYLTHVDARVDGDKFFNYDKSRWRLTLSEKHPADAQNKYAYEYTVLERR